MDSSSTSYYCMNLQLEPALSEPGIRDIKGYAEFVKIFLKNLEAVKMLAVLCADRTRTKALQN